MEPEVEKSDSEASGEEEQEEESTEKRTQEAKEQDSKSIKLEDLLEKEARAFYFGDGSQMGRPVRQSTAGPCAL